MRFTNGAATLFCLAALLSGCGPGPFERAIPSVERSTIRISAVRQGDLEGPSGPLKNVIYVEEPPLSKPNSDDVLFVVDAKQHYALAAKVHYGAVAGPFIIVDGVKPGDQVLVNDMARFGNDTPKIMLTK